MVENEIVTNKNKILTENEKTLLKEQNSRLVSDFKAKSLENDARKYWDLFYKRNENRFFKDRHWTTREFNELLNQESIEFRNLLEVGCGVGNFIYPLLEDGLHFFIYACDLSQRAIDILKSNLNYNPEKITAFQSDITTDQVFEIVQTGTIDIVTLIFVLSAIHPNKFRDVLERIHRLLKPGGIILFRDYGLYDMAQLRFKPGHKIAENFYMRQDGTRSYYFSVDDVQQLFEGSGFKVLENDYIHRRTVNKKENIDVPRIFVQLKAVKIDSG